MYTLYKKPNTHTVQLTEHTIYNMDCSFSSLVERIELIFPSVDEDL